MKKISKLALKRAKLKKKLVKLLQTWENCILDGKAADEILDLIKKG